MEPMHHAARAFAALDLTPENTRLAEIRAEIDALDTATLAAEDRRAELARAKNEALAGRQDGSRLADALLSAAMTGAPVTAAASVEALDAEITELNAALRELRNRRGRAKQREGEAEADIRQRVGEAARPMVDTLHADAEAAAELLLATYAGLTALERLTGSQAPAMPLRSVASRLTGGGRILPQRAAIAVPAGVLEALAALEGKSDVLPNPPESVPVPWE